MVEKNNDKYRVSETKPEDISQHYYTYGEYYNWDDGKRYELIDGVIYDMSPGPGRIHQEILMELGRQFSNYLLDKKCKAFMAPFDVRLPDGEEADDDIKTVVQPDLMVICDLDKLDDRGCRKAPDLTIEILSPYSSKRDKGIKKDLYQRHGVREYWIVNNDEGIVEVYLMSDKNSYGKPVIYRAEDKIRINVLEGLEVDLSLVFRE